MHRPHSKRYSPSGELRAMDLTKILFAIFLIVATVTAADAADGPVLNKNPITECIKANCRIDDYNCHGHCYVRQLLLVS